VSSRSETVLIIPAAGAGTRLQSSTPKVLSQVNGKAMIDHLFDRYRAAVDRFVLVVHPSFEPAVKAHAGRSAPDLAVEYATQDEPTGMLDAILLAMSAVSRKAPDRVWITWCDQIGIHPNTVSTLARTSVQHPEAYLVFPTASQSPPYIHIERDSGGRILGVRQKREGDPMPPVGESDMGLFSLSAEGYFTELPRFEKGAHASGATRERNFLPFIPWLVQEGRSVLTFPATNDMEALGVNTPDDRRRLEAYLATLDET
jgi:bifunctional UDP-N-acetylglucosamine pyrophosphorylase/glucosamine-1-phosphate N-acetyltransferase